MGWWVVDNLPALEKLACISYMQIRFVTKKRRDHAVGVAILFVIWVGIEPRSRET
jgi:hypothetical protein